MAKYLIDFVVTATDNDINEYFSQQNCTVEKTFNNFEKVFLVSCITEPPKNNIIEYIIHDDTHPLTLLDIEPLASIDTSDEKNWWKLYSLYDADLGQSELQVKIRGTESIVYILDSGIKADHSEFTDASVTPIYSITTDCNDTTGHGTGIASLAAGKTCGLTNAKLRICKIFDKDHDTSQSELISAFDAVIEDYLKTPNLPGIVNLSWCIPKNQYIENKIRMLIDNGLIVIASAGNSGQPIGDVTPASMPEVLTVGSYNQNFLPSDFSDYSNSAISVTSSNTNHGALDGWAPGENIWVATINGSYGYVGGTSVAAAILTSILAYNFDHYISNSELLGCLDWQDLVVLETLTLGKRDILDLSDIKYQNSVNKIATLLNTGKKVYFSDKVNLGVKVNTRKCRLIYQYDIVDRVDIITPLPPGFRIEKGWLIGEPIQEPDTLYTIYESKVRYIFKNGETSDVTFNTAILKETYDESLVPLGDPILSITLLVNCITVVCSPSGTGCSGNTCPGIESCGCVDPKIFCECSG